MLLMCVKDMQRFKPLLSLYLQRSHYTTAAAHAATDDVIHRWTLAQAWKYFLYSWHEFTTSIMILFYVSLIQMFCHQ